MYTEVRSNVRITTQRLRTLVHRTEVPHVKYQDMETSAPLYTELRFHPVERQVRTGRIRHTCTQNWVHPAERQVENREDSALTEPRVHPVKS